MTKSATEAFTGKTESQVVAILNDMAEDMNKTLAGILGAGEKTVAKVRDDIPEIKEYAKLVSESGGVGDKLFEDWDDDTRTKWVGQYDKKIENGAKLGINFE